MLSVVIPAFNEEEMIPKTVKIISDILYRADIPYELIFVDDGSKDGTWEQIKKQNIQSEKIRGIHFSRNFGKEAAIMAGISNIKGDCSVVIDCDLQHPPCKIVEMYKLWLQGYEIVEGCKTRRGNENIIHTLAAKFFYCLISKATGLSLANTSDFKLLDKKVVAVLVNLREKNAFFRALSFWIGFKTTSISFEVQERKTGQSKWSTWLLIKYALNNITSFSAVPMQIVTVLGGLMFLASLILGTVSLIQKINGQALEGFTTVILLLLFSGSMIMMSLGIIGYYIAKIYDEIKDRPRFIVSELCP